MEPHPHRNNKGLAPILGWSNDSPSLSPTVTPKTPAAASYSPQDSSGIVPDSASRTVSFSSNDFFPAMSSIGYEPSGMSTLSSLESRDPPKQRRETPPSYTSIPIDKVQNPKTVIIDNPLCENVVKFPDTINNKTIISSKDDSICSSGSSEAEEENPRSKVPDGGWGWVIVFASLVISMVADGISFSFGLLYIEFLKHFGESKSKTSWIGSLFMAVPLLSGPIGSALVDRYGCRTMTMLGGLISGIGFILSALVNSIELMYLTFGVIAGLGLGFCYVTAVVSIAYWFDKKRALAIGLGACGTGIGTFVYAPMTQYFIETYGWRGTVLLLAGTFLNMCVCGALMREPEWWTQEQKSSAGAGNKSQKSSSSCGSISGRSGVDGDFPGLEEIRQLLKSGKTAEFMVTTLASNTQGATTDGSEDEEGHKISRSVVNLPTFISQRENVPLEVLETLKANKKVYNVILENYPSLLLCRSISDTGKLNSILNDNSALPARVPLTTIKATKKAIEPVPEKDDYYDDLVNSPLLDKHDRDQEKPIAIISRSPKSSVKNNKSVEMEIMPSFKKQIASATQPSPHYLKNLRVHRNSVMYRGAMLNIHKYRLRASSCPDIYRNSMTTIANETDEKWYTDMKDLLKGMVDFSMFLEWHFLLMSVATILLFTWFIVPYFYLAELMVRNGYTEQEASTLLSVIGFTNFVGMIFLGWAGDQPWMNITKSYAVLLILCGITTLLMPIFVVNYWILTVTVALFGLFFASNFSFTPPILVQLIPLERFTTAYGLMLLCQGIGNLLGPPLGGLMFDITGTWDLSFYVAGVWIIVAGVLIVLIPATKNRILWGSGSLEMDADKDKCSNA
ncbi:hypothetical protein L9F63_018750 [Diploptera punctata]|uniref:Major facilitator superfamily (MFS) profile domain-containing protein n=1 Tax=Diploptera punctata TaxID=6984 RepID=A0AAD7ZW80_DIPPU|nr:hypothetical protein L9F63_018750 [Diploptera punctata]